MKLRFLIPMVLTVILAAGAEQASAAQEVIERTGYLPEFETTRSDIKMLEENLAKTGELAEILRKGNDELSEAIKQYRQDRSTQTKDRVYNLLGELAGNTVRQIDGIVANKDKMSDGVQQILYKMQHIKVTLGQKKQTFDSRLQATMTKADELKQQLRKLAKQIKSDPENTELRKEFKRQLFALRNHDRQYKTYQAYQRLNEKFAGQIDAAEQFFTQLRDNTDTLAANLQEQKDFLAMRIGLLRDTAQMEAWLRDESNSSVSAFAMMKKISELSGALEKFNAATDVLVEMNDIGTLIDSLPDAGEILGIETNGENGEKFEDKYIEYFLNN